MRASYSILTFVFVFHLFAQKTQETYLDGKALYRQGAFLTAQDRFASLLDDVDFGPYASFYYALSAYQFGDKQKARDMWMQLLDRHPDFEQTEEVHYWLTYLYFDQSGIDLAMRQAQRLSLRDRRVIYSSYLLDKGIPFLLGLIEQYAEDEALANILVKRAQREPLPPDQEVLINEWANKFKITYKPNQPFQEVKKNSYSVAVLFPFMSDQPEVYRNALVTDLFQGIKAAANDLFEKKGIQIDIYPYDTKKSLETTEAILNRPGLREIDLIIGPLYPEPLEAVKQFSLTHQVNFLNPISSSTDIVEGHPFGLLLPPSNETMADVLARYAKEHFRAGDVWIYYEKNARDEALAEAYKAAATRHGMEVDRYQQITEITMQSLNKQFTDQRVRYLGIGARQAEYLRSQGRDIRTRRRFDERGDEVFKADGSPDYIYYEIQFANGLDSLSHIFAVTRSNLYASSFVSLMAVNGDSVGMIGMGDWLDFNMLSYNQLENLNISLVHPDFVDRTTSHYENFRVSMLAQFQTRPSLYHAFGYESVWWVGQMMNEFGTYFQRGFKNNPKVESLFGGRRYGENKDNQEVQIVRFEDHRLIRVNANHD